MPDFDPDEYLKESESFNPDAYLAEAKPESIHPATSAILGAGQGITLGFGDEIGGMAKALVDRLSIGNRLQPKTSLQEDYRARQQEIEQYLNRAERENPKSYVGGNIVGGVATMAVPGLNALAPVKGASAAANIGRLATAGALAGAGSSKGNIDSYKGVRSLAADALKGGAIGGVTGAAFEGAGKVFGKYLNPEELRKFANEKTVKAVGATASDMAEMGTDKIQKMGAQLRKDKVISGPTSLEEVERRLKKLKEVAGPEIGNALKKIDDNVKSAVRMVGETELSPEQLSTMAQKLGVEPDKRSIIDALLKEHQWNGERVAKALDDNVMAPYKGNFLVESEIGKVQKLAEKAKETGIKPLEFGQGLKKTQGDKVNFMSETVPAAFQKDIYGVLAEELENAVNKTGNLMQIAHGGTDEAAEAMNKAALEAYQNAKSTYANSSGALEFAERGLGRERGNRQFSITDYLAGVAAQNPLVAPAFGTANKLLRKYGNSTQATAAEKLADIIDRNPNTLKPLFNIGHKVSSGGQAAVGTEKLLQELLDQRGRR